ncbi:phage portal protein [Bacillus safensis]|uniref:phage portal protein n=1 Tax=Bacillus safensis TaxID=561879 RepID=UPI002281D70F|nr:phage portal protein [Bacillus safensis]MCY7543908.1 phage portal protein [Bacillus safensis]MCY7550396.1 phage portal protein [Bacillus safensis]MCY7644044.1 phage portal protein [Bacillus safensis]MCY7654518.1 phage portal protein [Bacillus safensis]MEC3709167.1 phage portal protein [Bacillus safensis]
MKTVRATVMKANVSETTKQIYDDGFNYDADDVIEPPYNIKELKQMAEYSTILQQCIDAYKTNILGFGFGVEYAFDFNAEDVKPVKKKTAEKEWTRLEEFTKYMNYDESADVILGYVIEDREKTGNGFVEVLREGTGKPAGIEYLDAQYIRVCKLGDSVEIDFKYTDHGEVKTMKRMKRFRKYVQQVNTKKVFFKEYGDPRILNCETGKYDDATPEPLQATEVIHFKIGSGTYGVPRWIGNIVNMYGARKAEELNYLYFKQGRHVPAAITVENGMLSESSYEQLQEYMNGIEGSDNAHKFLLLEVEGIPKKDEISNDEEPANVKVDIKSLAEILQEDALFLEYDEKTRNKIRSSFRLPPIYTGESQDYNKATADTARKTTEEQVFQPERMIITGKLNTLFLPDLDLWHVRLILNGPDFRDPLEIAKVLTPFIQAGAVSPNDLRDLAGRILGKTLEEWPEEEYHRPIEAKPKASTSLLDTVFQKSAGTNNELISILKDLRDELEEIRK